MGVDCFWDTSGFFALLNSDDAAHGRALQFLEKSQTEKRRGVTSSWVIGETCTLLVARKRAHLVPGFLDRIQPSHALRCIHPDQTHFARAANFLRKHLDQGYSFVDCSSLVLMQELRLRTVLTTDRHFVAAGHDAILVF